MRSRIMSNDEGKGIEKLDGVSPEMQLLRKQLLVESLLRPTTDKKELSDSARLDERPLSSSQPSRTLKLPPSSVLSRVKNFLPVMRTANEKLVELQEDDPDSGSLEVKDEDDTEQPFVEMNLALMPQDDSSEDEDVDTDVGNKNRGFSSISTSLQLNLGATKSKSNVEEKDDSFGSQSDKSGSGSIRKQLIVELNDSQKEATE